MMTYVATETKKTQVFVEKRVKGKRNEANSPLINGCALEWKAGKEKSTSLDE